MYMAEWYGYVVPVDIPSLYTLHPVHIGQHRLEEAKSSKQAKLLRDFLYYFTTHAYKHVTSDVDCAQRSQTISR